jgi:hypothetical protein
MFKDATPLGKEYWKMLKLKWRLEISPQLQSNMARGSIKNSENKIDSIRKIGRGDIKCKMLPKVCNFSEGCK